MTIQEHQSQGHDVIYLRCSICWPHADCDAAPAPTAAEAPMTDSEMRGMERVAERMEAARPSIPSAPCRRCGTYCYGDCAAN